MRTITEQDIRSRIDQRRRRDLGSAHDRLLGFF